MEKPFIGLTRYEIGWPPVGYAYLYLDFGLLKNMTHREALEKLELMGYEPRLRYQETINGLTVCALLTVAKLDDPTSPDNPFEDVLENLYITFDGAIRSPSGRPDGYLRNIGIDPDSLSEITDKQLETAC